MSSSKILEVFKKLEQSKVQNSIFFQKRDTNITYKQLLKDVDKLHLIFQKEGLKSGDRIILSTNNDYYTSLFFLAFLRYGIVTVFLDPEVQNARAASIIEKSEVKGFVMDEALFVSRNIDSKSSFFQLPIKKEAQKKGKLFNRLLKNKKAEPSTEDNSFPAILSTIKGTPAKVGPVLESDGAYVIFTSGTTSDPKGVKINHGNLFNHLITLTKAYGLNENARILNILVLYHADGCIQGPLLALYNQATWIRPFSFDLAKIGDLFNSIYKYRTTHFIAVPTILSFMDKFKADYEDSFQTEDFKCVISASAKLEEKLWTNFENTFKTQIINVYGLTETVAGSFFCTINPPCKKGTIGLPIDCEAKIIKEDGSIAVENEEGVLYLKGKHVFEGYLNNPQATNEILIDGWLDTGDIAIKDTEGFYKIVGRSKNTIIAGGLNIYPEQVTEMINTNAKVSESICVGVPDDNFGEKLVAAIITKTNKDIEKAELIEFLRPLLEQNQIPKEFYFFSEFPKGLSGKIQINEVLQLIKSKTKMITFDSPEGNHQLTLKKAASEAFGVAVNNITMSDTSNTLEGWDSMGHLVFITNLEERFKVQFSTAEMMTMNTLKNSEQIINQKLSKISK
jgi:long-chain acyl-CoA synthetase